MRRAGAFRRHHACADGILGCTDAAENRAVLRRLRAAEDRTALSGLIVGDRPVGTVEAHLGIEPPVLPPDAHRVCGYLAQTAPFEAVTQLEHVGHECLRLAVAVAVDRAGEL